MKPATCLSLALALVLHAHTGTTARADSRAGGDDCASATLIESIPYLDQAAIDPLFQDDYSSQLCSFGTGLIDAVYTFEPGVDQSATVTIVGDWTGQAGVYVFAGSCSSGAEVACMTSSDGAAESMLVNMTGGVAYYFVVDGTGSGTYRFGLRPYYGPDCDAFTIILDESTPCQYPGCPQPLPVAIPDAPSGMELGDVLLDPIVVEHGMVDSNGLLIEYPELATVCEVHAHLQASHVYISQLMFELGHDDLVEQRDITVVYFNGYSDDGYDIVLRDDAAEAVENAYGPPPYYIATGEYRPAEIGGGLNFTYAGGAPMLASGDWTLHAYDGDVGATGEVTGWGVTIWATDGTATTWTTAPASTTTTRRTPTPTASATPATTAQPCSIPLSSMPTATVSATPAPSPATWTATRMSMRMTGCDWPRAWAGPDITDPAHGFATRWTSSTATWTAMATSTSMISTCSSSCSPARSRSGRARLAALAASCLIPTAFCAITASSRSGSTRRPSIPTISSAF